jgi:hypothetical protein
MRTRAGDSQSATCPLCDATLDSAGSCADRCDEQLTRVTRESITYVYVHDSAGSPRRAVSGRPIADH